MMSSILLPFTLLLAAVSPVSARAIEPRATAPAVLLPSEDPFYSPPAGFEFTLPGTVLRSRTIKAALFGQLPINADTYQLLYRTTAVDGSAIATVTTVFRPKIAMTDRFVSFHTAYDSSSTKCNPSYNYQQGANQTNLIASAEFLIVQAYLLSGYIVSSPDYEGPDAAFTAGRLSGMAVLDSMRAVTNFGSKLSFSTPTPQIVGVGYSGGAIATGWAASLHRSYASELPMKGWVQGGTPANLTGTLVFLDYTLFSGFVAPAVDGLRKPSAYGAQLEPIIDRIITPKGRELLEFAATHCALDDVFKFAEQSLLSTDIQTLGPALLYEPTIMDILEHNIMGSNSNETPIAPVLVYHATKDEIIPYSNASTLVDSWCKNGASVSFTTYASGGHLTTEVIAVPEAIQYVAKAFAGKVPSGCSTKTVADSEMNPLAMGLDLEPALVHLVDALAALGRGDSNVKNNLSVLSNPIQF